MCQHKGFEGEVEDTVGQKEISSIALRKNSTSQTTSVVDDLTLLPDHNEAEK